jgi:hypothetical protein
MTAQAGASSSGSSSAGAQERNIDTKDEVIEKEIKVYLYKSQTAFQKGFINEGVIMKR